MEKKVIISTGGTGGHINPAIAMAEYLIKNKFDVMVVGNKNIEKYLKGKDIKYKVIDCGYSVKNFKSLFNIFKGVMESFSIIHKFGAGVVLGFGSYTTLPTLLVAKVMKKIILLHEGNSFLGRTNSFFLKDAEYLFTSFQEVYGVNINYSDKIYFTGIPMKEEIKKLYNNTYTLPKDGEKFKILITSGSGGASFFSDSFLETFSFVDKKLRSGLKIYHQVKEAEEVELVKTFYESVGIESEVKMFFDDLPQKILESHLVICRSGSATASELAVIGRPAIFVPSPNVKDDHQLYNANFYEKNGAGIVLEEKYFIANNFAKELTKIIKDKNQLKTLAENIKSLVIMDTEEKICKIVEESCIKAEIS